MSSLAIAELPGLVTWAEFQNYPEQPDDGRRYELHDGEVVVVPPARPIHIFIQLQLLELLAFLKDSELTAAMEFPYRPALNYQFWVADVAVIDRSVRKAIAGWKEYEVYAPPVVIEVLSPSNTQVKIAKQRIASMSNGTREFWIVDADKKTVHVTTDNEVRLYHAHECISLIVVNGTEVPVARIFGD